MSLINNMLRDLEARRRQEETKSVDCPSRAVTQAAVIGSKKAWYLLPGLVVLAAIVWFGMNALPVNAPQGQKPFAESARSAVIADPGAPEKTAQITVSQESPQIPVIVPDIHPVLIETKLEVSAQQTEPLLQSMEITQQEGQAQLRLDFAQLPEYRLLQNDLGATQLVVSFSGTKLGQHFAVPAFAADLIQRVSLLPQQSNLQLMVDLDERARVVSFQLLEKSADDYQLVIEMAKSSLKEQTGAVPTVMAPSPVSSTVSLPKPQSVTTPETTGVARVSKNANPVSQDQQAYQAGLAELKAGDNEAAEASFIRALTLNPQLFDARLRLIDTLLAREDFSQAENQLRQGLITSPDSRPLRKLYARLLLQQQRQHEALELLRRSPLPAIAQDLEYHALMAVLLQETGEFAAAGELYGRLLQVRPEDAVWWLGLAVSLDQTGEFQQARNAYERALALPGLRRDLHDYIHNRLQVL